MKEGSLAKPEGSGSPPALAQQWRRRRQRAPGSCACFCSRHAYAAAPARCLAGRKWQKAEGRLIQNT